MTQGWRKFFRNSARDDRIEVRIAVGGEEYGHTDVKKLAQAGQWICRNPKNGQTWLMSNDGMVELYGPVNSNDPEWNALVEQLGIMDKKKKKNTKKTKKGSAEGAAAEKISSSFDQSETGPLFFGDPEEEKEEDQ